MTPHSAESAYRRAASVWFGLPRYASDTAHREALAAIGETEAALPVGRAREVLDEALGAFWCQTGRCGLCGRLQDNINEHLGRRILTGALDPARKGKVGP